MKRISIKSILKNCFLFLTCYVAVCGQAATLPNAMRIEGYGEIELMGLKWSEPFDATKVEKCMKAVSDWYKGQLFDEFRVKVFPEHDLVKSIKKGPVVVIRPEGQPDVVFWLPLKDAGKKILIETPSTAAMKLVAPPQGETLDLTFAQ